MSASVGALLRTMLVAAVFTQDDHSVPAVFSVGLTARVATLDSTSADVLEPFGADYRRVPLALSSANWVIASAAAVNRADVVFPAPITDWGRLAGWALFSPDNQALAAGILVPAQTVLAGSAAPRIPAGAMGLQLYA